MKHGLNTDTLHPCFIRANPWLLGRDFRFEISDVRFDQMSDLKFQISDLFEISDFGFVLV